MSDIPQDALSTQMAPDGAIVVRGDIDMAGGPVLEATLLHHDHGTIVLDLEQAAFIDSSGLRGLLEAGRRARSRGDEVVLRGVGPEVMRLLEITGTAGQFTIESRRD